jgi:hypothetical protein
MWKEAVVAYIYALSQHLSGGPEEKYEKPQSEWPIIGPRFEAETYRIPKRSVSDSTTTFVLHAIRETISREEFKFINSLSYNNTSPFT